MAGLLIETVAPGSPAERAGLQPGQSLLTIDGQPLRDLIDYAYLAFDDEAELTVIDAAGTQRTVQLEPEPGEPLGLVFAPPQTKRCGNNCVFCFVHQLPKGLRRPLYVKDEDYRLSFLQGTYVTLTNLKKPNCAGLLPSACRRSTSRCMPPSRSCVNVCWAKAESP